MTYSEMERELNEIPKFGAKASLSNLSAYLELANHPERNLRVIHIAGTNGKGSVSAYIDSILRQAGYTTCLLYTSVCIYYLQSAQLSPTVVPIYLLTEFHLLHSGK